MSDFLTAARFTDKAIRLPHQDAAWNWAWGLLTKEQQAEFLELFRAEPDSKLPVTTPAWLAPALECIKKWEGLRLEAYPDPGTGAAPWTIGYGATRYPDNKGPVRKGDVITASQAEAMLKRDVLELFGPGVLHLFPVAGDWKPNQIAALVSWGFNVGLGAVEDSTLRRRILDGEDPCKVVQEELPRWNKGGNGVLEGLKRRRAYEVKLFCEGVKPQVPPLQQGPVRGNPLVVPWFSQRDSATDQAERMCMSSSVAMMLAFMKPGVLVGANGDDFYLKKLQQLGGDTTDPQAHLKTLKTFGINATFTQKADFSDIESQINRGVPVPCGYLHRGEIGKPSGGGHWLCVVGYDKEHVVVHDPWGEADLITGQTVSSVARYCKYSRKNWGKRWMVEGAGTGWAIIATPLG